MAADTPFLQPIAQTSEPSANFASAQGSAYTNNYSHQPSTILTDAQTATLAEMLEGGVAIANANAQATFITYPTFSELFFENIVLGEGGPFQGIANSHTEVIGNFLIGADQTFSFDFLATLQLIAKEIENPNTEYSETHSETAFLLLDTTDFNNPKFLDHFVISGELIPSEQFGDLEVSNSDNVALTNRNTITDIDGDNGTDFLVSIVTGIYQQTFSQDTDLTLVAVNTSVVELLGNNLIDNPDESPQIPDDPVEEDSGNGQVPDDSAEGDSGNGQVLDDSAEGDSGNGQVLDDSAEGDSTEVDSGNGQEFLKIPTGADYNGDGQADIVWRNPTTGVNSVWILDPDTLLRIEPDSEGNKLLSPENNPDWVIAGIGNWTPDTASANDDILWRNQKTGQLSIWVQDGTKRTGFLEPNAKENNTDWVISAVGDFDGDAVQDDIAWQNSATGQISLWFMDGAERTNTPGIVATERNTNWELVGAGDFNQDGNDDLLFYNSGEKDPNRGILSVWLLDGDGNRTGIDILRKGETNVGTKDSPAWRVQGTADYNADGQTDILWRNFQTGANGFWLLNPDEPLEIAARGLILSNMETNPAWMSIA